MIRRTFVELVGSALAVAPTIVPKPRAPFKAWTWVHGNNRDSSDIWRAKFARIRAGGISGVLVGGGDIAMIAAAAHAEDLTFHAWPGS